MVVDWSFVQFNGLDEGNIFYSAFKRYLTSDLNKHADALILRVKTEA